MNEKCSDWRPGKSVDLVIQGVNHFHFLLEDEFRRLTRGGASDREDCFCLEKDEKG